MEQFVIRTLLLLLLLLLLLKIFGNARLGERFTTYQSKDQSPIQPTYRKKEGKGKQ